MLRDKFFEYNERWDRAHVGIPQGDAVSNYMKSLHRTWGVAKQLPDVPQSTLDFSGLYKDMKKKDTEQNTRIDQLQNQNKYMRRLISYYQMEEPDDLDDRADGGREHHDRGRGGGVLPPVPTHTEAREDALSISNERLEEIDGDRGGNVRTDRGGGVPLDGVEPTEEPRDGPAGGARDREHNIGPGAGNDDAGRPSNDGPPQHEPPAPHPTPPEEN